MWFLAIPILLFIIYRGILSYLNIKLSPPVLKYISLKDHQKKVEEISKWFCELPKDGKKVTRKTVLNTHLFGLPIKNNCHQLDLSEFRNIISKTAVTKDDIQPNSYGIISTKDRINDYKDINMIHVQANALISQVITELLRFNMCLQVVPDMTHLTFGGLFSGVGGGACSFKYGSFADSITQVEYVNGIGQIVITDIPSDIDALSSSLGTLGYILSLKIKIRPVSQYVLTHTDTFDNFEQFNNRMFYLMTIAKEDIDFLDGTIFGPNHFVVIWGNFLSEQFMIHHSIVTDIGRIGYYKSSKEYSILTARLDIPYWKRVQQGYPNGAIMKTYDYIYRWDPEGYYSSMKLPKWMLNKTMRQLFMHDNLMSATKLRSIAKLLGIKGFQSGIIQEEVGDFLVPFLNESKTISTANGIVTTIKIVNFKSPVIEFNRWFRENVALYPVYICPAKMKQTLLMSAAELSMDWGLGYGVSKYTTKEDKMNLKHKMMEKTYALGGDILKYFAVFKSEEDFWKRYPESTHLQYKFLKKINDPCGRFYSMGAKLVS